MFDKSQTSFNIIQHHTTCNMTQHGGQTSLNNMLHSTMLNDVESRCGIRLIRPLELQENSQKTTFSRRDRCHSEDTVQFTVV